MFTSRSDHFISCPFKQWIWNFPPTKVPVSMQRASWSQLFSLCPPSDVNECSELNKRMVLCKNAQCINTLGSYRCVCLPGFTSARDNYCVEAPSTERSAARPHWAAAPQPPGGAPAQTLDDFVSLQHFLLDFSGVVQASETGSGCEAPWRPTPTRSNVWTWFPQRRMVCNCNRKKNHTCSTFMLAIKTVPTL